MRDGQLGEVLRELAARGFRASGNKRGTRTFVGDLDCRGDKVRVELHLADWDFINYPPIKVLSGVDIKTLTPHINQNGWLCYFQQGSIVLDRYAPAASIAQCIEQAHRVLNSIKFDPKYRQSGVQDEFMVHWLNGQSVRVEPVMLGTVNPASKFTQYWLVNVGAIQQILLSSDEKEVAALSKALGAAPPQATTCPCWLFESSLLPTVPEQMPATMKALFKWLQEWDVRAYHWMQRVLETEPSYLKYPYASFAIKTPIGWLGFGFELDPMTRLGAKKRPNLYRQHLHGKGGSRGIVRLAFIEMGPDYVHSRNLTFKDLRDKTLTLVGCGAVGSYIAQALIRLGAGTGKGKLTLIDPDEMKPENLGRHALGYPALFHPKASVLRDELTSQFPLANVEAVAQSAQFFPALMTADLVIDATGEEAVSEMINARRLALKKKTPVLHAWILGNGEAVQTLWTQGTKTGCYRCLSKSFVDGRRVQRFQVLNQTPVRRQLGCQAFTPYAVSAPMSAASLATEVIVDWLQKGSASPMLRTRAGESADVRKTKNQDPTPIADCPACGTFHAS